MNIVFVDFMWFYRILLEFNRPSLNPLLYLTWPSSGRPSQKLVDRVVDRYAQNVHKPWLEGRSTVRSTDPESLLFWSVPVNRAADRPESNALWFLSWLTDKSRPRRGPTGNPNGHKYDYWSVDRPVDQQAYLAKFWAITVSFWSLIDKGSLGQF